MNFSVPPSLRPIAHYVKIAQEYSQRDIVISYWALYYAVQAGMKIDRSSPDAMKFLVDTLGYLESVKKANANHDEITSDVVAQAYIENHALKLFNAADQKDRAADFGKNIVKIYYTAGHIFDILTTFGELDESLEKARKYAKWKATYIHNCLKNGETPMAGPPGEQQDQQKPNEGSGGDGSPMDRGSLDPPPPAPTVQDFGFPQVPQNTHNQVPQQPPSGYSTASYPDPNQGGYPSQQNYGFQQYPQQPPHHHQQPQHHQPTPPPRPSVQPNPTQHYQPQGHPGMPPSMQSSSSHSNIASTGSYTAASDLKLEDFIEARKFLKFAMSAIDYEDGPAAIENMMKSIRVLQKLPPS